MPSLLHSNKALRVISFLFFLSIPAWCRAQALPYGAYAASLADAVSGFPKLPQLRPNPAVLAYQPRFLFSTYAGQGFGLSALRQGGLKMAIPTRAHVVGLSVHSFGNETYREVAVSFALSGVWKPASNRPLYLGLSSTVRTISIDGFGTRYAPHISAGYLVELWPALHLGLAYETKLYPTELAWAARLHVGLGLEASPGFWLLAGWMKERGFSPMGQFALETPVLPLLALQVGLTNKPLRYSAGLQIRLSRLRIGFSGTYHIFLGWTPSIAAYLIGRRPKAQP